MSGEAYEALVQPRGPAYKDDQIVRNSHYREPIDQSPGRLAGNSRRWGDASPDVQSRVIDALIEASTNAGLSPRETAHVLAIARAESGFNPDAAAGTTTAAGIGQFVDGTARGYGLNDSNRFDVQAAGKALVDHFIDNRNLVGKRGQGEEYIYKYHHDGPFRDYGGLQIARNKVMPYLDRYEQFVRQWLGLERLAPDQARQGNPGTGATRIQMQMPARTDFDVLEQGATGSEVRDLQTMLRRLGYTNANGRPLATDGDFGRNTDHAVREFQRARGLAVDGRVGPDAREALAEAAQRPLVSEATHPNHHLFQAIARQLPEGADPRVTANITLQALENGITGPEQLKGVAVLGRDVHLQGSYPGARVSVDLDAPTPDLQAMSDHMARQTQEQQQRASRQQRPHESPVAAL